MAGARSPRGSRWWRLSSANPFMVDATTVDGQVTLIVASASALPRRRSLRVAEARYYGVDRPAFGGSGQIQRITGRFLLDVLTSADLEKPWVELTDVGQTRHPPDAYGPGTTLAVWRPS